MELIPKILNNRSLAEMPPSPSLGVDSLYAMD
jgi:hypothetical protein